MYILYIYIYIYISVIWLSHSQLWAIIEGTTSLTHDIQHKCHLESRNEVEYLNPAEHLVGFEQETSDLYTTL